MSLGCKYRGELFVTNQVATVKKTRILIPDAPYLLRSGDELAPGCLHMKCCFRHNARVFRNRPYTTLHRRVAARVYWTYPGWLSTTVSNCWL